MDRLKICYKTDGMAVIEFNALGYGKAKEYLDGMPFYGREIAISEFLGVGEFF